MDNNQDQIQPRQSTAKPDWLKRFLRECKNEGEAFIIMRSRLLTEAARLIVWYFTDDLECHENGVPGQACRIVEWFIVHKIRHQPNLRDPRVRRMFLDYMRDKMLLIVACSVLLAAKMNSRELPVTARETNLVLGLKGVDCKLPDVLEMKMKIYKTLDYHVPTTTSVEIGEMLAHELKVEPNVLPVVAKIIDEADLHRYDIETSMRRMTKSRGLDDCEKRVRTLYLAAGGVAAALKTASEQKGVSQKLAKMLQTSTEYIKCIRDVILEETAKERPVVENPLAILQRKRKSFDDTYDAGKPGTSKHA
uniref:Cyclin N-terminal domain-containing protein n=2 Tax=Pararge aegeria TaxID=116150 RepID=S4NWR4_9NEOP